MKETNKTIRKILNIALCLSVFLSSVPILSFNAGAAETVITAGETLSVNGIDSVTLKFVPESDGEYTLVSDSFTNPYVTLYNSEMSYLADADDYEDGYDFRLVYTFTAGEVYYFVLGDYDNTDDEDNSIVNYSVTLTKSHEHQGGEVTCKGQKCDICGENYGEVDSTKHQGGTATCIGQQCELCYTYYGEIDENNHDLSSYATCQGQYCYLCYEYVKGEVDLNNHLWENSVCVCGAVCEEHIWEDGYCNICEAGHEHQTYDEDGKCTVCGYQYYSVVVINGTTKEYYREFNDAVGNAPEGSTIKLIGYCCTWGESVYFEKSVTLDLNGQIIDCVSSEDIVFNANVTIEDSVGTGKCAYIELVFNTLCTINGGSFTGYLGFNAEGTTAQDYLGENKNFYSMDGICPIEPVDASQATSLRNVKVASSNACSYDNGFCIHCGNYETPKLNSENYYEIDNAGKLFWFSEKVNGGETSINAVLTGNIVINPGTVSVNGAYTAVGDESVYDWTPIGNTYETRYTGVFNGNNKTVSGLYFNDDTVDYVGLFGCIGSASTIKNVSVENSFLYGKNYVGAIVGLSYGKVSGSSNNAFVKANLYAGGIVGMPLQSNASVVNCYNTGTIEANKYAGGISGHNQAQILNCYNTGLVTAQEYVGEITSENYEPMGATTENCYYLATEESDELDGTIFKTAQQFASGEVAYLLQQGNTEQVWGQDSNQTGAAPILDSTGLYKVVTVGETGNYSVANVGDTNVDGTVNVNDYQALVNAVLSDNHEQIETANYNDIVKFDLDGDGYIDVIDASLMALMINSDTIIDVYSVGDYDLNGVAFEEADILAMAEAMGTPETLATYQKYACDINADGKINYDDLNALTSRFPLYFVGEE